MYYKCSNYLTGDNREIFLYNADGESFDEDFADDNNSNQFFNFMNQQNNEWVNISINFYCKDIIFCI